MKFLIPLLFVLASSQADKHPGKQHHNHTDIEALARKLATLIFQRIQETDNIQPIPTAYHPVNPIATQPIQTYAAYAAVPVPTYAAEPIQTYEAEPIQTNEAEPVQTYEAEPVQTYAAEPVHSYVDEPMITSYRRHKTVKMPLNNYYH